LPLDAAAYWLIGAMLLQGALALGLIWYLGFVRIPMIVRGEVRVREIALSRTAWPEREKQVSNAVDNQFQLPVLFHVACLLSLAFGSGPLEVVLALAFVLSRYVHAFIHVTSNHVIRRFWAYTAGLALLCGLWLVLVVRLVLVATGAK